ncbi:MAG: 2Fe-2S iron-sulfur cluster binding domain-containing protein [Firmicutes bacterium]|nr:2Fe-2S iron-sulfur cluster binding domain-containing protein [Bacillota bacterium]
MEVITLTIDGRKVEVTEGTTIMQAADSIGIHIPRLCYHPQLSVEGACRVCVVEVEGARNLAASCATPASQGMVVHTSTPEIRQIRRDIVELLLDNHPKDCQICERDGNCELQRLAYAMGVRERLFEGERKQYDLDLSSPSVIRDPNKCILCARCVRVCSEIQGVSAIGYSARGFKTVIMPEYNAPFEETVCVTCGQCINVCPTAAFLEKDSTEEVWEALSSRKKHVVVQIAPSVRAAIGEGFGREPGVAFTGQTVAALRRLGFARVFDTQFGADLTIMEEASELVDRLERGGPLPMITSCSAAWIKFCEHFYPELLPNLSTCKSPMSMLSAIIKTYYAEKIGIEPGDIFVVAAMCCTAKKFEARRPQLRASGYQDTDAVITTRELILMMKSMGIDLPSLEEEDFDHPLGFSSGGGTIFGTTGGVMESALRTAYYFMLGETLAEIEFTPIRGLAGIKEAALSFGARQLNVAVAHGLGNAHKLLERVLKGEKHYDFIEIMGCPGGCIGGGGQPYAGYGAIPLDPRILRKRAEALYGIDKNKTVRRSYENPEIQRLYREFLGAPLSDKAHRLLHTSFVAREPSGIRPRQRSW